MLEAFNYLDRYGGLTFLDECYEAEHLLSIEDAIHDLVVICKKQWRRAEMILYHGTNIDIQSIDLEQCMPYKDFGRGFYLTDLEQQAKDMALRKAKFNPNTSPYVLKYEFDEKALNYSEEYEY